MLALMHVYVSRLAGAFNRNAQDTKGDVRNDNPEFNPFATGVELIDDMYASVTLLTIPDPRWSRLLLVHNKTWVHGEDSRDVFQLVQHLHDEAISTCGIIVEEDKALHRQSTAKTTRNAIHEVIRKFKVLLLGHPINIILGAFMVKDYLEPIFDYDQKNGERRSAKSFLESFPFDYLAAVYKQTFDYVVRKETVCVTTQSMIKDQENLQLFSGKATQDVHTVGMLYIYPLESNHD